MRNPFEIVEWFEEAIAEYTGATYAIAWIAVLMLFFFVVNIARFKALP